MMKEQLVAIIALVSTVLSPVQEVGEWLSPKPDLQELVLAKHSLNLNTRSRSETVNDVFKYNILLAVEKLGYSFILEPGEVFAFHENVLAEFSHEPLKTNFSRYTAQEGYKTALGLPGNGVCHLATLMNWVAADAGLEVTAKVAHDFAPVPEVPREYGTSIRYMADGSGNSANQNLYIENTLDQPVEFVFEASEDEVSLKIIKG